MERTLQITGCNVTHIWEKKPLHSQHIRDIPYVGDRRKALNLADRFIKRYRNEFFSEFNDIRIVDRINPDLSIQLKRIVDLETLQKDLIENGND
jgi:hypothetical protein